YCTRINERGRAMRAWIDRTNDGLSGMPADGISLPLKRGTSARPGRSKIILHQPRDWAEGMAWQLLPVGCRDGRISRSPCAADSGPCACICGIRRAARRVCLQPPQRPNLLRRSGLASIPYGWAGKSRAEQCCGKTGATSEKKPKNDAVDGAHSAASRCHRVVASKRTTLRGAVHGRG